MTDQRHVRSGFASDDRFDDVVLLPAGETVYLSINTSRIQRAPADREMNLSQMSSVEFFVVNGMPDSAFFIDNLRLTN